MRNFHSPGRSSIYSRNGMVATSHPIATKVAIDALNNGGNAIDAALAAAFVMPICEPHMTGLFGDMFALIKLKDSTELIGLNSSGKSPAKLNSGFLRDKGMTKIPSESVHAITLPGAIKGLERLAQDYSNLGLSTACNPAIFYSEKGIPIAPRVAFDWGNNAPLLQGLARKFYLFNNKPPKTGQIFQAPGQAEILKGISENGSKHFYEGEVAQDIIKSLKKMGGLHTHEDLQNVNCEYVDPISASFKNYKLIELPPNGQGATALLLGKILKHFKISDLDPMGYERIHIEAEATKLAYKMRNDYIGDYAFLGKNFEYFHSEETALKLANKINLKKASPNVERLSEEVHLDTVLITVVDKDRNAVSLIFSIFHPFGSGHCSEKFGLLFQNRGAGFVLKKNHPNELLGGKKPMHTIIPAMVESDGQLMLAFGVMGGQYQPVGHIRILSNLMDYDMNLQEAIDLPRSFADSNGLILEKGYSSKLESILSDMGHNVIRPISPLGGAQAIMIENHSGLLIGGSDPRKDGCAMGY